MPTAVETWAQQIRSGEVRAISRAITAIENHEPAADALLKSLFYSTGRASLIGITGAPGTGKSTLVDRLAASYRRAGKTVGVIAVDPTSPFTGGAILGDRIRMQGHASDAGIFIRSMATRGFLGGLARATSDVSLLLDAAGKEIILIETVGVGQDEVDIVRLADCTLVLLVPGLGDDVQNMKAGLMEIGDVFVINKSDREGADRLEQQVHAMLELSHDKDGWRPAVTRTIATESKGIDELVNEIAKYLERAKASPEFQSRETDHWSRRLIEMLESRLLERLLETPANKGRLVTLALEVAQRKKDPYAAVEEILASGKMRHAK
ncbi:MAG TPA: methylmalonyl Co-A mutase-associated GTPase MeaB [Candidatus Acidoferrales bacterium]|nr:methylmalonyl Co-A mutase-associated GTPase MeaB [Candidatus Acidoferrales bacterium]